MKLMRLGPAGHEKPVVRVDETHYVDVSDVTPDFDERFFGASEHGGGMLGLEVVVAERIAAGAVHPFGDQRIGAPIARPHQILCIGLNYSDHAAESGMPVPDEPILFTKSPNTLVGPNDDVRMPRGATKLDWEVELGIVIGTRTSYLDSPEQARDHIAGYVVANDVSADPMGGESNRVHIVSKDGVDSWDRLPKDAVARKLMEKIADELETRAPVQRD